MKFFQHKEVFNLTKLFHKLLSKKEKVAVRWETSWICLKMWLFWFSMNFEEKFLMNHSQALSLGSPTCVTFVLTTGMQPLIAILNK